MSRRTVASEHIRTSEDFLLMQLSWVFDINFVPTLRRIAAHGYLERLVRNVLADGHRVVVASQPFLYRPDLSPSDRALIYYPQIYCAEDSFYPTLESMAAGMRQSSGAAVALSATGIAGPTGGSAEKPVGLVCIGIADRSGARAERVMVFGTREQIKVRAAKRALNILRLHLEKMGQTDG